MAMKNTKFGRIGVLMGGPSAEREISLKSGKAVYEALKESGQEVVAIDIKSCSINENIRLIKSKEIDCAFLALHGFFGEDGQIQKILAKIKIPYTGSGIKASRLAMDKISSHRIFERAGLNVPRYVAVSRFCFSTQEMILARLRLPLVIKPASCGSSMGLSIINKVDDLKKAVKSAFLLDTRVIIEEYIKGREMTVGILNELTLPVIEVIPKNAFFDFQAKYHSDKTVYVVPARIEEKAERKIKAAALKAHKLLDCFGCSRVDIILSQDGRPFVLELNTIPGMTGTSLLPKAAKEMGLGFGELCLKLIKLAYEKNRR